MIHSYPIRVGIIGLGKMGQRHIHTLQKNPHLAKLCAVFDVDEKKVIQTEQDTLWGIGTKDYWHLLERRPDAVIIATPIETHAMLAMEALGKEISVLVEKPMADNIRDAEIMINMARDETVLMVGYTERFNGAIQILKEEIKDEPLIAITTRRAGPYLAGQPQTSIIDALVTHDIDLISYLTRADFEDIIAETDGIDFFNATFKLTNGMMGNIEADKLSPFKERIIRVWGKDKYWVADLITQKVQSFTRCKKSGGYIVQDSAQCYTEPLREELGSFLHSVALGKTPPVTGEDGLRAIRVAEKCR